MKKFIKAIPLLIIVIVGSILIMNVSIENVENEENYEGESMEILPEEEISTEVNYDTKLLLYFEDEKSGILTKEERMVNAKELIDNPYLYVMSLLIGGPNEEGLINPIPKGTKVNNVNLINGTLNVDLSSEFLEGSGPNSIYSIVETMCEFNEVNNVKITINGEEKEGLKEKFVKMDHNRS